MIEITELKFVAQVAVNDRLETADLERIRIAVIEAINKHANNNLLIGTADLTLLDEAYKGNR